MPQDRLISRCGFWSCARWASTVGCGGTAGSLPWTRTTRNNATFTHLSKLNSTNLPKSLTCLRPLQHNQSSRERKENVERIHAPFGPWELSPRERDSAIVQCGFQRHSRTTTQTGNGRRDSRERAPASNHVGQEMTHNTHRFHSCWWERAMWSSLNTGDWGP